MGDRTHCVSVRFSPEEIRELDRRRGKIQKGTFLRNVFLGKKEPRQIPEINREQYVESSRWAANLNQIARGINAGAVPEIETIRGILAGFRVALLGIRQGEKEEEK